MKVTPQFITTFETGLQTRIVDSWARIEKNMMWQKIMETRPSTTGRELFFWLLETAGLYDEAQGGNKRFDDLGAIYQEIINKNSGAGLRLTKNEIEDNQMASGALAGMPALDYAASWAKQVGSAAAYWPQDKLFNDLIANGKTTGQSYDAVAFFGTTHPINPLTGAGGNYSNLITAKPLASAASVDIASANLASVITSMRSLKGPNGKQRMLRPRMLLADPSNQRMVTTILGAKFIASGAGATEQVWWSDYDIKPVIADELAGEAGVWYLVAEEIAGEGSPFIFQDREPYKLTSYTSDSQVELQRRKEFEWDFSGRNAVAYGHPYLIFRVEPT